MSRVYDSLFHQMQARLQAGRLGGSPGARLKANEAATMKDELEEFQKYVDLNLVRFKEAITVGERLVDNERREAEDTVARLRNDIARLQEDLRATQESVRTEQEHARQLQESHSEEIHKLKTIKEQELEAREKVNAALREKADAQSTEIRELQYAFEESKLEIAGYVKRIEVLTETFSTRTADLERRLLETEKTLAEKEAEAKSANESWAARWRDLKERIEQKDTLLKNREAEITQLQKKLRSLTHGIKEMSSFFTQVDAFDTANSRELIESIKEPSAAAPDSHRSWLVDEPVTPASSNIVDPMPPDFFRDLTAELTEAVGPIASVIIGDQVKHLGCSIDQFPKERLTELLDLLVDEIMQPGAKTHFRTHFSKWGRREENATTAQQDSADDARDSKAG